MRYSRSVKVSILKKILPPEGQSIRSVSKETGVSEQTIRKWKKQIKNGKFSSETDEKSPRNYSPNEKYHLVIEAARLSGEDLGGFLRERGLHTEHLTLWDQELREMIKDRKDKKDKELKARQKRIRDLERELTRKEKALAEAAALLVLKKKLGDLTGEIGDV